MKSTTTHQFSQVPKAEIPRSTFNRSHGLKTTFDEGYLVPIFVDEALPGDTFNVSMTAFTRLATPIFPVMDNMVMDIHFFAVPNRILWDNWKKFNGEQTTPGDSTDYTVPIVTPSNFSVGGVFDYLGVPTSVTGISLSALFPRAYNRIFNDWYRDENLVNPATQNTGNGPDGADATYPLRRRAKRHDYFTSCLPWPQKGASITIPLGSSAPVSSNGLSPVFAKSTGTDFTDGTMSHQTTTAARFTVTSSGAAIAGPVKFGAQSGLFADLSSATGATINALRQSFQIQRLLERDARGGSRYTEIIKSHFGVTSPDARLQRPEFLGGGSIPINISQVPQTSSTDATTPQGNLAAYGTGTGSAGFTKSFTEHCIILGIASVRSDLTYQQGVNRMFSRKTRYDFYWPALSHIGEQAVLRGEIYADGTANDAIVFGYQERYAEYRYKPSQITGLFRSTAAGSLDSWHLAQEFVSPPTLSSAFIQEDAPLDRVIAIPSEPHFLFDSYFSMSCARPMPVYGVPGFIDHF